MNDSRVADLDKNNLIRTINGNEVNILFKKKKKEKPKDVMKIFFNQSIFSAKSAYTVAMEILHSDILQVLKKNPHKNIKYRGLWK